ncbi:MAG TPA: hypothetical protein DCR59_03985, partial [Dehalococcoidia bacterium]|nr:hypothetical protein [Dehalococcoidia bacterium]
PATTNWLEKWRNGDTTTAPLSAKYRRPYKKGISTPQPTGLSCAGDVPNAQRDFRILNNG